jgi:hypothetical protein
MPLSDRLRLNSGRPFIYTLVARVSVALTLITIVAFMNMLRSDAINNKNSFEQHEIIIGSIEKPKTIIYVS